MKATIPYIERKFEEFNQQMFAGKLPKLPIELSDAKTFLGACVHRKRRLPNGEIEMYDFRLRINTRIDLPKQEVEDTIIHEMIHYFIGINKMEDTSSHGPVFQGIMNTINEKYGRHLTISHKGTEEQNEQAYDTKQHWHVVAVVDLKDGKTGVKVLPRVIPRILNFYNTISSHNNVVGVKLFMSNNIFFNRFPNSSALTIRYVDKEEVMGYLKDSDTMECDGSQIVLNGKKHRTESRQKKPQKPQYHVIAALNLTEGKTGVKVLPRVLPTILKYYNEILKLQEVQSIELYMSNNPYFDKYPNSGTITYHYDDRHIVMAHLQDAEHMKCDGTKVIREKRKKQ